MVRRLCAAGVTGVAIERGDGPVVEELLTAGLAVFVVPSRPIAPVLADRLSPLRAGSAPGHHQRRDRLDLPSRLREARNCSQQWW
jgi:hypothetical protein